MDAPQRTEHLICRHEGLRQTPYICPAGKLTIGVGRNLEAVGITEEEALYLFRNDLGRVRAALDKRLSWWRRLDDVRQAVLISMAFQLGPGGLLGFRRLLAALEAGQWAEAAREMLDSQWARQTPNRAAELAEMVRGGLWPREERL